MKPSLLSPHSRRYLAAENRAVLSVALICVESFATKLLIPISEPLATRGRGTQVEELLPALHEGATKMNACLSARLPGPLGFTGFAASEAL